MRETELKAKLEDAEEFEAKLAGLGAVKIKEVLESDAYFDDSGGAFKKQDKVLRIRKSDKIYLAYKGPRKIVNSLTEREEIELAVSDFDKIFQIMTNLGFHPIAVVEKRRKYYRLGSTIIVIDTLPFIGTFAEIEGDKNDIEKISQNSSLEGLAKNYTELFHDFISRNGMNLGPMDFTFQKEQVLKKGEN